MVLSADIVMELQNMSEKSFKKLQEKMKKEKQTGKELKDELNKSISGLSFIL